MYFWDEFIKWKAAILFPEYIFWRKRINNEPKLSPEQIQELNWQRTKAIFDHAFLHIPFYRAKYTQAGVSDIRDVACTEDFERLPILTKDEVRHSASEMIAVGDSLSKLSKTTTGGSTGEPLCVYRDRKIPYYYFSREIFATWGIGISDNSARINRHVPSPFKKLLSDVFLFPQRKCFLNANHPIDDSAMDQFTQEIRKIRPTYIKGYMGAVLQYAEYCRKKQIVIPSLKAVWTSSAPLPESVRCFMQEVFHCKVYTQYGCCEIPHLASECGKQNGMHINYNIRRIEIIDDQGKILPQDTLGRVIVTDLLDYRFPLVRYCNGDTSRLLSRRCDCGLPYPLMDYVRGRISDTLQIPGGGAISGDFLTTVFDALPNAVKAFQFVQKRDGAIEMNVVPNSDYANSHAEIEMVKKRMEKILDGHCSFTVHQVDEINHDRGKQRFIIREQQ